MNLITDDESLPLDLKERISEALREVMNDDPEGVEHATVVLEFKATVMPRPYMEGLVRNDLNREVIKSMASTKGRRKR